MREFRKSLFYIDGSKRFEGYTYGEHWNGWACPRFTKEVGLEIVKEFGNKDYPAWFDEKNDRFIFQMIDGKYDFNNPEHLENFEMFEGVDREGLHLYSIGAWSWVWDDEAED